MAVLLLTFFSCLEKDTEDTFTINSKKCFVALENQFKLTLLGNSP